MQQEAQNTVFISYRRSVSAFIARAVFQDLRDHGYDAFMDVESIDSGHFDQIILNQIEARAHFVLVLTPGTVERCAEPGDWLRKEIEYAMDKQRNIVPLLINNFSFEGTDKFLTGKLADLGRYNGVNVPADFFDEAMDRLRNRFLKQPVYAEIKLTPASDQPEVQRKIEEAEAQPPPSSQQLDAEAAFYRGAQAQSMNDHATAIREYNEALRLNPQFALAVYNRALAKFNSGDLDGAFTDYDTAIRISPHVADGYVGRGWISYSRGNLDAAITDFNTAINLNPQYALAYNNRGLAYAQKGNPNAALADYSAAIYWYPQFALAYLNRGMLLFQMGNANGALMDYNAALMIAPQFPEAYNSRGWLFFTQGNFPAAMNDYSTAISLNPQFPYPYKNRGMIFEGMHNAQAAIADYQAYLNLGGGRQSGDQAMVEQRIRQLQGRW